MQTLLAKISAELDIDIRSASPVRGGDIHDAYRLETNSHDLFVKVCKSAHLPGVFEQEAAGLQLLRSSFSGIVPEVLLTGEIEKHTFMVLEWLDETTGTSDQWERMGVNLARMHGQKQAFFGYEKDNYIGSMSQRNTPADNWATFFIEQRVRPLLQQCHRLGMLTDIPASWLDRAEQPLTDELPLEPAALLHGDLWSGNCMPTRRGIAIYDPAVYFGHREMDLAMTRLFGGFPPVFYEAYESIYPLADGARERLPLMQLYPLLVHAVLFGGQYVGRCREVFHTWFQK